LPPLRRVEVRIFSLHDKQIKGNLRAVSMTMGV
jgi:hypothetical protein